MFYFDYLCDMTRDLYKQKGIADLIRYEDRSHIQWFDECVYRFLTENESKGYNLELIDKVLEVKLNNGCYITESHIEDYWKLVMAAYKSITRREPISIIRLCRGACPGITLHEMKYNWYDNAVEISPMTLAAMRYK